MEGLTFGPINSRRFGLSLGVDLSPKKKTCNYDCIYCELQAARPVELSLDYPSVEEVVSAITQYKGEADVLTLTANGEPSLYPELLKLIKTLKSLDLGKKILILSNGTGVLNNYEALLEFDLVKLSLDSVCEKSFKRINKPFVKIDLNKLIQGITSFSKEFKGELILESLFIEGVNDSKEDVGILNSVLANIKASRLDISSLDRPPAYPCKGVSQQRLEEIAKEITSLPVLIARRKDSKLTFSFSKDELYKLLCLRPASYLDTQRYDAKTQKFLKELLVSKRVKVLKLGGVDFYKGVAS